MTEMLKIRLSDAEADALNRSYRIIAAALRRKPDPLPAPELKADIEPGAYVFTRPDGSSGIHITNEEAANHFARTIHAAFGPPTP